MGMRIREAREDDIEAMHAIRMGVRENRLSDPGWLTHDVYRGCLASGRACTWVADDGGVIRGFSVARLDERDLWALFVDPACERGGIGRALLDTAVRWLFEAGVDEIRLSTDPGTRADHFYRGAGWTAGALTGRGEREFRLRRPLPTNAIPSESATC